MSFTRRLLRRIGTIFIGALSCLSTSHAHSAPEFSTTDIPYRIDTEIIAFEENPECDPGNFKGGKPSRDIALTMRLPAKTTEGRVEVSIGLFGRTTIMFNRPLPFNEPLDIGEEIFIKYPVVKVRQYMVEARGQLNDHSIDAVIKLRRLGEPKKGKKRFCQLTFRMRSAGRT